MRTWFAVACVVDGYATGDGVRGRNSVKLRRLLLINGLLRGAVAGGDDCVGSGVAGDDRGDSLGSNGRAGPRVPINTWHDHRGGRGR